MREGNSFISSLTISEVSRIALLNFISQQLYHDVGIAIFVFTVVGNFINWLVLSQRTRRVHPCTLLFLFTSFASLISILIDFTTRILATWNVDPTGSVLWLCKWVSFTVYTSHSLWLIMLASVDRWLSSSPSVAYRHLNSVNIARQSILACFLCYIGDDGRVWSDDHLERSSDETTCQSTRPLTANPKYIGHERRPATAEAQRSSLFSLFCSVHWSFRSCTSRWPSTHRSLHWTSLVNGSPTTFVVCFSHSWPLKCHSTSIHRRVEESFEKLSLICWSTPSEQSPVDDENNLVDGTKKNNESEPSVQQRRLEKDSMLCVSTCRKDFTCHKHGPLHRFPVHRRILIHFIPWSMSNKEMSKLITLNCLRELDVLDGESFSTRTSQLHVDSCEFVMLSGEVRWKLSQPIVFFQWNVRCFDIAEKWESDGWKSERHGRDIDGMSFPECERRFGNGTLYSLVE